VIGSADGLAPRIRAAATHVVAVSSFTLPHALVRILVAEQLYRAASLIAGHPYHRE
jgi:23S rRNA (pseudouridine1915-N3)-methyltransferase